MCGQTFESLVEVFNQWEMCFVCWHTLKIIVDSAGIELLEEGFCEASLDFIGDRMRVFFSNDKLEMVECALLFIYAY